MSSTDTKSTNWVAVTMSILLVIALFIILGLAYNQYQQNQAINESINSINDSVNSLQKTVQANEAQRQADANAQKSQAQATVDSAKDAQADNAPPTGTN